MNFNILIVEDEVVVLDTLVIIVEMFLESEYPFLKLNISKALNGYEALEIAKRVNQDIILSDIVMPKMDGFKFIQEVRRFDKSVPILVFSALSSKDDIEKIMKSGATNYTSKPLNEQIFTAQIRVFVDLFIHRQNRYNTKAVNLFSKKIYRRKTEFFIEEKNDLLEFWEFVIRDGMETYKIDSALQYIYDVEQLLIKKGIENTIVLEEDNDYYYISVSNMEKLGSEALKNLKSHELITGINHKKSDILDSFLVQKTYVSTKKEEGESVEQNSENEALQSRVVLTEIYQNNKEKIESFLEDLHRINSSIYNLEESQSYEDARKIIDEIVGYLHNFDNIIKSFGSFELLNETFSVLINFLESIDKKLIEENHKRILLAGMLFSIIKDLHEWIVALFLERNVENIHYFDTIFSDKCSKMIATFLNEKSANNEENDHIHFL